MNEQQLRQILNQGTEVKPPIAARLAQARQRALELQRPEPAPVLAWADNVVGHLGGWGGFALRVLLPTIFLAVAGSGRCTSSARWRACARRAAIGGFTSVP